MTDRMALVMDVDGVVSPVKGHTPWGDDVVAGQVFGPVIVSPALCARLDALAQLPGVQPVWLTDWSADMRSLMAPFPGAGWPAVADPEEGRVLAEERAGAEWELMPWWKWWALGDWLDNNPGITSVVWCDDDLRPVSDHDDPDGWSDPTRADFCEARLRKRGVNALLISPRTDQGLSPQDLLQIEGSAPGLVDTRG